MDKKENPTVVEVYLTSECKVEVIDGINVVTLGKPLENGI